MRLLTTVSFVAVCALLLSACATHVYTPLDDSKPFARNTQSNATLALYDYPRESVPFKNRTLDEQENERHTVRFVRIPSIGDNGQDGNLITAHYYKSKSPQKKPLVIVLPLWGSYKYPSFEITHGLRSFEKPDRNVLYVQGEKFMLDWQSLNNAPTPEAFRMELTRVIERFRTHVVDVRRLIDWAQTQSDIDANRIALIGFSHGALVASLVAATEPRLRATVLVMGGANLPDILATCSLERTDTMKQRITQRFGWTHKRYREALTEVIAPIDVSHLPGRVDPRRVLMIDAHHDECMPQSSRDTLWETLGKPERISYEYGHKTSFLSMTVLGGYSMRNRIYKFLNETL